MKRATGNNFRHSAQKVSIQLVLDGHSFSSADLPDAPTGDEPVEVEVLTAKTMIVPAEAFDASCGRTLLSAAGISAGADDRMVFSDPQRKIIALMAVPSAAMNMLHEKYGSRIRFLSPLLQEPSLQRQCIWLCRLKHLLYIKVYAEDLQLAEAIETTQEADIVYLIEQLGKEYPLAEYTLQLAGDDISALDKLLGKRFKKTVCE